MKVEYIMHRAYAFLVSPRRTVNLVPSARGGRIEWTEDLGGLFSELLLASKLEKQTLVHLLSDQEEAHPYRSQVRDELLGLAYGNETVGDEAAQAIASRLSLSMDQRSAKQSLLVMVIDSWRGVRRTIFWLFPQDDVFRLESQGKKNALSVLGDVFSKSSTWRKAAMFWGGDTAQGFRTGRVIDVQSKRMDEGAADFWIRLFLHAQVALDPKNATAQLAVYLKDAFESSSGVQRDQLYAAIVGLPRSPERAWTFQQIAERYLDDRHQDAFLNLIPENVRQSAFEIDSTLFESKLNFRVFETQDGVWISAPNSEVGRSVRVIPKSNRIVVEGLIKSQSVRSRHVK